MKTSISFLIRLFFVFLIGHSSNSIAQQTACKSLIESAIDTFYHGQNDRIKNALEIIHSAVENCPVNFENYDSSYQNALFTYAYFLLRNDQNREGLEKLLELDSIYQRHPQFFQEEYPQVLSQLSRCYYYLDKYDEAIKISNKRIELAEIVYQDTLYRFQEALNDHGLILFDTGQRQSGIAALEKSLSIVDDLKQRHTRIGAIRLYNLATFYCASLMYDKCEACFSESKKIIEEIDRFDDRFHINVLINYSKYLAEIKKDTLAISLIDEAIEMQESYFKSTGYLRRVLFETKVEILDQLGQLDEFVIDSRIRVSDNLDNWNSRTIDYMSLLRFVANLYTDQNLKPEKALQLGLEVKGLAEKHNKTQNSPYLFILNDLAINYQQLGKYGEAIEIFHEIIKESKNVFGKESSELAAYLNNIGNLYSKLGLYQQAIYYLEESRQLKEKITSKNNPDYAQTLQNIAGIFMAKKDYKKTLELYEESFATIEKFQTKEDLKYNTFYANIGAVQISLKNYKIAKGILKTVQKNLSNKKTNESIELLNLLGYVYYKEMNFDSSMHYFKLAGDYLEQHLDNEPRRYFLNHSSQAHNYEALDSLDIAYQMYQDINKKLKATIINDLTLFGEYGKIDLVRKIGRFRKLFYSFVLRNKEKYPDLQQLVYNDLLFFKELALTETNQLVDAIENSADQELKMDVKKWQSLKNSINDEMLLAEKDRSVNYTKMRISAYELEAAISRKAKKHLKTIAEINTEKVQEYLKSNEAAIEFFYFDYTIHDESIEDKKIYCALVLKEGDVSPHFIPLFDEAEIKEILHYRGATHLHTNRGIYGGGDLFQLIWAPLDSLLHDVNTVYISPAGILHKVAFQVISTTNNKLLSDEYEIIYKGSTKELSYKENEEKITNALLIGGVDFFTDSIALSYTDLTMKGPGGFNDPSIADEDELALSSSDSLQSLTDIVVNEVNSNIQTREISVTQFDSLKWTRIEIQRISKLLNSKQISNTLISDNLATESFFKSIGQNGPSPRILHIATHGFYYPPKSDTSNIVKFDDSMFRSGILLAGANNYFQRNKLSIGEEDGIVYSYEIADLNLRNTELVVLSGCETGLGDSNGEGIFGLKRAFKKAGVKHMIMSLWPVDDEATAVFMESFYNHWLNNDHQNIQEAFHKTQEEMQQKYKKTYFWGAFVLY